MASMTFSFIFVIGLCLMSNCVLGSIDSPPPPMNRVSDPGDYDNMFPADFNIDDLIDELDHMIPVEGWNDTEAEMEEVNNDIPGIALDPEEFLLSGDPEYDRVQSPTNQDDPITTGTDKFEGDIRNVDITQIRAMYDSAANPDMMRNAIKEEWRKWPGGVVPYVISSRYSQYERRIIAKAMQEYKKETCIRFIPRTNQRAYIHIVKGSGCSSSVGRTGRVQSVSLGNGCVYPGIVIHELMHAIGFWHEQSRADRDRYVKINTQNIIRGMEYNFLKYSLNKINHLQATYDTCSVMHYGPYAFSRNRRPTISRTRESSGAGCELGQRNGFSETDKKKINTLYKCKGFEQTGGNGGNGGGGTEVTTEKPEKPDSKCRDTHKWCADWAKAGECQKNPAWMLKGCPVACNECKNECGDHNTECKKWASRGECRKNAPYMDIYCAKSCKKCSGGGNCKNSKGKDKDCKFWAKEGYCKDNRYVNYMKLRCKKACKFC